MDKILLNYFDRLAMTGSSKDTETVFIISMISDDLLILLTQCPETYKRVLSIIDTLLDNTCMNKLVFRC